MNSPRIFSEFKICPRCGTRSGVNALACLHCGRKYKGQLPISPLNGNAHPAASIVGKEALADVSPAQRRTLNITNFYQLKRSGIAPAIMVGLAIAAIACSVPFLFRQKLQIPADEFRQAPAIYVIADPATGRYWPPTSAVYKKQPPGYIMISIRYALNHGFHIAHEPK